MEAGAVKILLAYGITEYTHQKGRYTEALVQKIVGSLNQKEFVLWAYL
jgi:hypothetical protein